MDTPNNGYYLGIKFLGSEKSYFFSCPSDDFALGDLVVVMTPTGVEAGKVSGLPIPITAYQSSLELKPILRKADEQDIRDYERNLEDAKDALELTRKEIAALDLPMDLIDAFYTLDGSKVTITYTSGEKRVDFRELLKVLAPQLGVRIELRQIASRDKAKMVGGIGICGLPLCCSTFLNQFEGISIQRAKNQMLTLNIPKLSGPCGKLICCLTYEDDAYTEAKKEFPRFGTVVKLDEGPYTVDAINILSKTVRLVDASHSDYKTFPLEDVQAMLSGTYKRKVEVVKQNDDVLPSFGLERPERKDEKPSKTQPNNQKNNDNRDNNRDNRHGNHRHDRDNRHRQGQGQRQQQGQQQNRPQQQQQQRNNPNNNQGQQQGQNQGQGQNRNRNRHRHRHHGHGNNGGNNGAA